MQPAESSNMRAQEINPYIHGLRGFLAMLIYTYHILHAELPGLAVMASGPLRVITDRFEWSVELFFGISGFVVLGALARSRSAGAFIVDRMIRIYPVLWPPVIASLIWGLMLRNRDFAHASVETILASVPANLFALPGMVTMFLIHPPAWSLSYEMAFYAFSALALLLHRRLGPTLAAAVWVPAALVMLVFYPRGAFFVSGVVVGVGVLERFAPARFLARFPLVMLVVTLALWGGIQTITGPRHMVWTTVLDWTGDARLPLALLSIVAGALFLQGVVNGVGPLCRLLGHPISFFLGTVSFSFYLWHVPALALTRRSMVALGLDAWAGPWSQLLLWVLALPPALLLGYLSWRWIEVGVRNRLRALLRTRSARGQTSSEAASAQAKPKAPATA